MSTGQSYSGKGDSTTQPNENGSNLEQTAKTGLQTATSANSKRSIEEQHRIHVAGRADKLIEDNNKGVLAFPTGNYFRTPLAIDANAFANNLDDVEYLSNIRFAVRSWFSCFIQEDVHPYVHGPSIEKATISFQDIDDFLSSLILAKYREEREENIQMRKDFSAIDAKINELEEIGHKVVGIDGRSDN